MSAMDCGFFQEQISAMLDGELTILEQKELVEHIAGCDECSAAAVALAAASGVMAESIDAVPGTLHSGVMQRVRAEEAARKRRKRMRVLRTVLGAAACLVVVVGTVFTLRGGFRGGKSASASASENANTDTGAAAALYNGSASAAGGAITAASEPAAEPEDAVSGAEEAVAENAPAEAELWDEAARNSSVEALTVAPDAAPEPQPTEAPMVAESMEKEGVGISEYGDNGESDSSGALGTIEVEVVSAGEGSFTGVVLTADGEGYTSEGETVTVWSGTAPAPGDRIAVSILRVSYTDGGTVVYTE